MPVLCLLATSTRRARAIAAGWIVALIVTPDGRISRALSALAVDATTLRLTLVEAGQGHVGGWSDQIHLLCYGFDPASGTYTLAARRLLIATSSISIIILALLIGLLLHREHATR